MTTECPCCGRQGEEARDRPFIDGILFRCAPCRTSWAVAAETPAAFAPMTAPSSFEPVSVRPILQVPPPPLSAPPIALSRSMPPPEPELGATRGRKMIAAYVGAIVVLGVGLGFAIPSGSQDSDDAKSNASSSVVTTRVVGAVPIAAAPPPAEETDNEPPAPILPMKVQNVVAAPGRTTFNEPTPRRSISTSTSTWSATPTSTSTATSTKKTGARWNGRRSDPCNCGNDFECAVTCR
jgi:hypothetical protein